MTPPARRTLAAALAVGAAAVLPYAGTLRHGFAFDDGPEVVENEYVRSLANVPRIFAHPAWKGAGDDNPIYRPLTTTTYALTYAVAGLAPAAYHAGNLLLHTAASVLVLVLALRLGMPLAAASAAGLLFAVEPAAVEVVANVAGRKDALATVLVLAALLAHRRAVERGGAALVSAPLCLAAAMFSKETGMAGLALVGAHDALLARSAVRQAPRRAAGLYAAYATALAGYLASRWAAVGSLGVPTIPYSENPLAYAPAAVRLGTAIAVVGRGLLLLVAPLRLSPDYSFRSIPLVSNAADPGFIVSAAVLTAIAAAAVAAWRRYPVVTFATVAYAAALLPASNLLVPVGITFAERVLYLPTVAFCLAVGWAVGTVLARAPGGVAGVRTATAAGAAALIALGARAAAYVPAWRDDLALFTYGARVQPNSSKMRQCLGGALMEAGRPAEAAREFEEEIRILSGSPASTARARVELGTAYEKLGRLDEAAALYDGVLRENLGDADARWRTGVVLWAQGRREDAVRAWLRTVQEHPQHARALSDLGIAYYLAGNAPAAEAAWLRAAAADPALASIWYRLGTLYLERGDARRARSAWSEFLRRAHGRFPEEQAEVAARLRDLGG